jgi:hypothetical protein
MVEASAFHHMVEASALLAYVVEASKRTMVEARHALANLLTLSTLQNTRAPGLWEFLRQRWRILVLTYPLG